MKRDKGLDEHYKILCEKGKDDGIILYFNMCKRCALTFSTVYLFDERWNRYAERYSKIRCPECGDIIDIQHERGRM